MSLETGKDFSEISFEGVIKANDISLGNVVEMFGISPGDGGDYEGMVFESIEVMILACLVKGGCSVSETSDFFPLESKENTAMLHMNVVADLKSSSGDALEILGLDDSEEDDNDVSEFEFSELPLNSMGFLNSLETSLSYHFSSAEGKTLSNGIAPKSLGRGGVSKHLMTAARRVENRSIRFT